MIYPKSKSKLYRQILYYLLFPRIILLFKNWYILFLKYLKLLPDSSAFKLHLRNKKLFKINYFLDAMTIVEVWSQKIYEMPIAPPKTILDIGANIGSFSVWAAHVYPQSSILAIEPSNENFKLLKENIAANHCPNITCLKSAIANTKGKRMFYDSGPGGLRGFYSYTSSGKRSYVPALTLKDIFAKYKIKQCDLMKVDCEGAEYEIFYSSSEQLKKVKNIVMEFHDGAFGDHEELISFLKKLKFKVHHIHHHIESHIGTIYAHK